MGGDCIGSDLVKISTGYDFVDLTLDVALGKELKLEKVSVPQIAFIKFIFSKKDLDKLNYIKENHSDLIYRISEISDLEHDIVDSSTRFGYYILKVKDKKQLKELELI